MHEGDSGGEEPAASDQLDARFLRAVLEAVPAFIIRLDPEDRIRYMNRLQSGFTLEDVIGRTAYEFLDPAHHERHRVATEEALRTGKPSRFSAKGDGPDGTVAHYECHVVPIDSGDGRRAVCVIALEVTEHVARAAALAESEDKLRIAIQATGLGLWSWDLTTGVYEADARTIELIGGRPGTAELYIDTLVHPGDRERLSRDLVTAAAGRPNFAVHRVVRPDGGERWLMPTGKVIKDEHGNPVRLIGGLLDVTEQHSVEVRLRQAQKMDAVGSLTAGVAHNFNNMLAVILPALDMALPRAESEVRGALEDAVHAAKRSAELITQLMTFAGQRHTGSRRTQPLAPVVERAVSMCQRAFDRSIAIEVAVEPNCSDVICDAPAIEQVVVNLLINARDAVAGARHARPAIGVDVREVELATPPGALDATQRYVRVRVTDNGTGMAPEVQLRAFEPFFTTKEPGKGTGLGLATSYGIVRDHSGSITLASQPGVGTSAEVLLPVADRKRSDAPAETPPAATSHPGTILVVDDEPAVRRVIELVLLERGHRVLLAADGESAVATLASGARPDLILLDRSMPGWSAGTTLHAIREIAAQTPLLFFTGQDVTPEERALVQDVLYKPLAMDELVQAIERWMRAR
jgi:PAS domain S-box-containing protein